MLQFIMSQGAKSRLRRDEMRTMVAHVFRLAAGSLTSGALQRDTSLRIRFMEFMADTLKYLNTTTPGTQARHTNSADSSSFASRKHLLPHFLVDV